MDINYAMRIMEDKFTKKFIGKIMEVIMVNTRGGELTHS